MKKFTNLEKDFLKESQNAIDRFNIHYKNAINMIELIEIELQKKKAGFENNKSDWGQIGDMYHVVEELNNICEFLGINAIDESDK